MVLLLKFCSFPFCIPKVLLIAAEVLWLLDLLDLKQLFTKCSDLILEVDNVDLAPSKTSVILS